MCVAPDRGALEPHGTQRESRPAPTVQAGGRLAVHRKRRARREARLVAEEEGHERIELVSGSSANALSCGNALSHFVIKVESMDGVLAKLAAEGITPDQPPGSPDSANEFETAWITDPDGNRIELVQWPPGHHTASPQPTGPTG